MSDGSTRPPSVEARLYKLEGEAEDRAKDAGEAHDDIIVLIDLQREDREAREKEAAEAKVWRAQAEAWFGMFSSDMQRMRYWMAINAFVTLVAFAAVRCGP